MEKQRSICHAEGLCYLVDRTELAMGLHMVSFRLLLETLSHVLSKCHAMCRVASSCLARWGIMSLVFFLIKDTLSYG